MATFCWEAGDEAGRRLAAVQLTELKAATQQQVAAAFGTDPVTVWRWADAYRKNGLAGLLPERRGPKGPSKLTPELTEKVRRLSGQGRSQAAVAAECGVSTFTVRAALGHVPARKAAPADAETGEPASTGHRRARTAQSGGYARALSHVGSHAM